MPGLAKKRDACTDCIAAHWSLVPGFLTASARFLAHAHRVHGLILPTGCAANHSLLALHAILTCPAHFSGRHSAKALHGLNLTRLFGSDHRVFSFLQPVCCLHTIPLLPSLLGLPLQRLLLLGQGRSTFDSVRVARVCRPSRPIADDARVLALTGI